MCLAASVIFGFWLNRARFEGGGFDAGVYILRTANEWRRGRFLLSMVMLVK